MTSVLYRNAIIDAIAELKERKGSSMIAIQKVMKGKNPDKSWLLAAFHKAVKAGIQDGYFIRIKNSIKLASNYKQILSGMASGGTTSAAASTSGERKRGRPPKNAAASSAVLEDSKNDMTLPPTISESTMKRKPGRPRVRELPDANAPKKPRGRPPKEGSPSTPKIVKGIKPRGRPRPPSNKVHSTQELINQILGKKRGRPVKNSTGAKDEKSIPKKRGRPRTKPPKVTNGIPKKRGRPSLKQPQVMVKIAPLQVGEVALTADNHFDLSAGVGIEPPKKKRGRPPIDPSLYKLSSISPKQIANAAKAAISVGQKKRPGRPPKDMSAPQADPLTTFGQVPATVATNLYSEASASVPFLASTVEVMGTTIAPMSINNTVPYPAAQHLQSTPGITAMPIVAKRGRPKKTVAPSVSAASTTPKRGRGRPPKSMASVVTAVANVPVEVPAVLVQEMPLIPYNITMTTTVEGSTAALAVTPAVGIDTAATNVAMEVDNTAALAVAVGTDINTGGTNVTTEEPTTTATMTIAAPVVAPAVGVDAVGGSAATEEATSAAIITDSTAAPAETPAVGVDAASASVSTEGPTTTAANTKATE